MISLAALAFAVSVVLRQADLAVDTQVVNPAGTAWLELPATSVTTEHKVRVKLSKVSHPENYYGDEQPISDLYRYNLTSANPITLTRKLAIGLSYPSAYAETDKIMKYYDSKADRWRKLSDQSDDSTALNLSGQLKKKHAIVAIFEQPVEGDIVQGLASWYDWTGAACNSFPMGSRIRTTNVATGASVDSTVVSTGPFIPGRIVDLTREDFAQIADLSAGVVEVTVQLVE